MRGPSLPFVGQSNSLSRFLTELEAAAKSRATVLLCGESGSGKTQAAELVHALSSRSEGPFVVANLAAIAPTLIEAYLFGHERGAFTDAHRSRRGIFEKADGGSVLLEGIDSLPLPVQVKLLRVIQERVVEPLGAENPLPVDVRVLATTTRDLLSEVRAGRFREDLYFRLAVVTLTVPPLRSRREDLRELCQGLLERVAERVGVPARTLSPEALERLRAHPWPGNVRELENALERVLVLAPASAADRAPPLVGAQEFEFLSQDAAGLADEVARQALRAGIAVEDLVRAMMERALEEHRGNVSAAARQIGLTRRAFDYRMAHGAKNQREEGEEE